VLPGGTGRLVLALKRGFGEKVRGFAKSAQGKKRGVLDVRQDFLREVEEMWSE